MKNYYLFLKIDVYVQTIIWIIVALTAVFVVPLGITLPILGGWQLFSGFVHYLNTKGKTFANYLIFAITYLILMTIPYFIGRGDYMFLLFIQFILIPCFIGMWYFVKIRNRYIALKAKPKIYFHKEMHEQILDFEGMIE